ncbi:MAG: AAA family ATPase [Geminicoccaceae bacterium]|nr:AAA family ATPase [Geminicoccaceae bacterium]
MREGRVPEAATYREFYRLHDRPFPLAPDLGAYLTTESHRRAVACLSHALARGEGVVAITGEAGVGKTTLVRYLEARLGARRVVAPSLPAVATSGEAILEALAAALGVAPGPGAPTLRAIEAALRARAPERGALLMVLDEAQRPAPEALDALRPVVGLSGTGGPLVRLLLVGRPELRDLLALPPLAWLRERVVVTHRLVPLEPEEVQPYVEHRLGRVGWQHDPRLSPDLFPALRLATGGLPRRINQLMTRLLVLAALDQRHEIGAAEIEEVADEFDEGPSETPVRLDPGALVAAEPAPWRDDLAVLRRRLDALYEELARERRRRDDAEAALLRAELQRLGPAPAVLGPLESVARHRVLTGRAAGAVDRG